MPDHAPSNSQTLGAWANLVSVGHSIGAGTALSHVNNRFLTKLARSLGISESNACATSTGFMTTNHAAYDRLEVGGNWVTLGQAAAVPTRSRAPYLSPHQIMAVVTGINDIAEFGPVNAGFQAAWKAVMTAACAHARCGHWLQDSDAAFSYGGPWASVTEANNFAFGSTLHNTAANGATVGFVVPPDYDGHAIDFFFVGLIHSGGAGLHQHATHTVTQDGVIVASGSSAELMDLPNPGAVNIVLPHVVRVPTPTPSTWQGKSLVCTVSALVNATYFNGVGFESSPAPLIILADTLRPPSELLADAYSGWPYAPITAEDITALNAVNRAVASTFSDGRVVCDGLDAVINESGSWVSQVHPDERTNGIIADAHRSLVLRHLTPSDVALLGMA